jgi:protein-S-isoprenylcysteine O-methyltransferase Ste14
METLTEHFGNWFGVVFFIFLYGSILFFIPFYKKMDKKPAGAYLAFVIAFAIEMHGIPFSMYLISMVIGRYLPEGILWGHTLIGSIGYLGLYLNIVFVCLGFIMIIMGWYTIYHGYWKKIKGSGHICSRGIYRFIRHPQYTGLMLIALGMLMGWATLPNLLIFPIIIYMYVRLAKREEADMIKEFNEEYIIYKEKTRMFIPFVW